MMNVRTHAVALLATALVVVAIPLSAAPPAPPQPELPAAFHGRWASSTEGCQGGTNAWMVWDIDGRAMTTAEGSAGLVAIRGGAPDARTVHATFEMGGGGSDGWNEIARLELADDGLSMRIAGDGGQSSLPEVLWRCAGPVPAQFLGRWGMDAAECANPYATREMTIGGFAMPEIGEWTIRIEPLGKRGDSLLMEYRMSIADMSYRGRRVVHLSRDGQNLTVDELGNIEIGSADPDWKPDPLARLLEPGEPPVDQVALVRCPVAAG